MKLTFQNTEEALSWAGQIDRNERDHIWFNYEHCRKQIEALFNRCKQSPEMLRERSDKLIYAATQNQFRRECVEQWDKLNQLKEVA